MNNNKEFVLFDRVRLLYEELKEYTTLYNKKTAEQNQKGKEEIKKEFDANKITEKVKEFSFDVFVNNMVHQGDINMLQMKFVLFYDAFSLLESELKFDEEIIQAYIAIKQQQQKQIYTLEKEEFVENEVGTIDRIRKNFKDNNTFEQIQEAFEGYLNNG